MVRTLIYCLAFVILSPAIIGGFNAQASELAYEVSSDVFDNVNYEEIEDYDLDDLVSYLGLSVFVDTQIFFTSALVPQEKRYRNSIKIRAPPKHSI